VNYLVMWWITRIQPDEWKVNLWLIQYLILSRLVVPYTFLLHVHIKSINYPCLFFLPKSNPIFFPTY
jgi:hypothetical protein